MNSSIATMNFMSLACELRSQHLGLLGKDASPTRQQRHDLIQACISQKLPLIYMARCVEKGPKGDKDKNWRGRALEVYLGGKNSAAAEQDFSDGELKSTRVVRTGGKWRIEQTLRITSLAHEDASHSKFFTETPLYRKISRFTCVLINSIREDIESGTIVGCLEFDIQQHPSWLDEIREDYDFYLKQIMSSRRVSSRIKSPKGFLGCRQTAGKAGVVSKTALYITKARFDLMLDEFGING